MLEQNSGLLDTSSHDAELNTDDYLVNHEFANHQTDCGTEMDIQCHPGYENLIDHQSYENHETNCIP